MLYVLQLSFLDTGRQSATINSSILSASKGHFEQPLVHSPLDVDYLGIGPIFPSKTKGYSEGLGSELAWIVSEGTHLPVFGIGGVTRERVSDLSRLGRVAVCSAILAAPEPAQAAREIRELLLTGV